MKCISKNLAYVTSNQHDNAAFTNTNLSHQSIKAGSLQNKYVSCLKLLTPSWLLIHDILHKPFMPV